MIRKNKPMRRTGVRGRFKTRKLSRPSKYQIPKGEKVEYKNFPLLQRFLTDRGKIVSRRVSGVSAKEQRLLSNSIKRARYLSLLPAGGQK